MQMLLHELMIHSIKSFQNDLFDLNLNHYNNIKLIFSRTILIVPRIDSLGKNNNITCNHHQLRNQLFCCHNHCPLFSIQSHKIGQWTIFFYWLLIHVQAHFDDHVIPSSYFFNLCSFCIYAFLLMTDTCHCH